MTMRTRLHRHAGLTILEVQADGEPLGAIDIIGEAYGQDVDWIAVPVSRLPAEFFRLRSGVLGEFTQKFSTYGLRLAVTGDISEHLSASDPFRAYVAEANRSSHLRFAGDVAGLLDLLCRTGR